MTVLEAATFLARDDPELSAIVIQRLKAEGVEPKAIAAATFGVAGAVTDQVARLTNVPWVV